MWADFTGPGSSFMSQGAAGAGSRWTLQQNCDVGKLPFRLLQSPPPPSPASTLTLSSCGGRSLTSDLGVHPAERSVRSFSLELWCVLLLYCRRGEVEPRLMLHCHRGRGRGWGGGVQSVLFAGFHWSSGVFRQVISLPPDLLSSPAVW